jgi:putative membrane protein
MKKVYHITLIAGKPIHEVVNFIEGGKYMEVRKMKIFKYFSILTGLLLLFGSNVFDMKRFYPFYAGRGMEWGCGGFPMGLIFLVVVGLIIYFLVKNSHREKKPEIVAKEETPLEILKRRYAKGEINQEEFKNMLKELQS